VGTVLSAASIDIYSEWFWCLLALFICSDYLSRQRGKIEGMIEFLEMSEQDQARLKRVLQQAKEESK
jgi:hypothetical protein